MNLIKKLNLDEYLSEKDGDLIEKYGVTTGNYSEWSSNGVRIYLNNIRVGISHALEIPLPIESTEVDRLIDEKVKSTPELRSGSLSS